MLPYFFRIRASAKLGGTVQSDTISLPDSGVLQFRFYFYEIRTYTRYYMIGFYAFIYFITMGLIINRLNIFYQRKFIKKFNKIHKQNYEIHCFMSKNIFPSGHEHSKIIDG